MGAGLWENRWTVALDEDQQNYVIGRLIKGEGYPASAIDKAKWELYHVAGFRENLNRGCCSGRAVMMVCDSYSRTVTLTETEQLMSPSFTGIVAVPKIFFSRELWWSLYIPRIQPVKLGSFELVHKIFRFMPFHAFETTLLISSYRIGHFCNPISGFSAIVYRILRTDPASAKYYYRE